MEIGGRERRNYLDVKKPCQITFDKKRQKQRANGDQIVAERGEKIATRCRASNSMSSIASAGRHDS